MSQLTQIFRLSLFWLCAALVCLPAQGASIPVAGGSTSQATAPYALKTLLSARAEAIQPATKLAAAGILASDISASLVAISCANNSQCDASSYCAKPVGACGAIGACKLRPDVCIALYDPVCGCDGRSYGNACEAAHAGTSVAARGACASATPVVDGFWPGDPSAQMVLVFGGGFVPMQTKVQVNGIPAKFAQVIDPALLFFMPPSGDTRGPIVVSTPAGSAASSSSFGVPLAGLQITGFWPTAVSPGQIVFIFGSGFTFGATKISVNGVNAPLMQILDPGVTFFLVPLNATTGFITVTTPAGSATSSKVLTIK